MKRSVILVTTLLLLIITSAAFAQSFGHLGDRFGRLGSGNKKKSAPLVLCSPQMNGKFDLTTTCNNIYLLTGVI